MKKIIICVFIVLLCQIFYSVSFSADKNVKQKSSGPYSPNSISGRDTNIRYIINQTITNQGKGSGVSPKALEALAIELGEKNVKIENLQANIKQWIESYTELEQRLAAGSGSSKLKVEALKRLKNGDIDGAEQLLQQYKSKAIEAARNSQKAAAEGAYELGMIKELKLKYNEALLLYEEAVKYDPDNTNYQNAAGSIYSQIGEYKKALSYFEKALEADKKRHGENHPDVAADLNNIGAALRNLGEYQKAIGYYERALKIDTDTFGENHPTVAIRLNNIGAAWDS
ncbi:MAG: tetratricopeptide repeat protein, partial [Nitrospirae bacterium]|nr:tetratricopeptide repeat protein [Nitrospirota bacterium]